LRARSSAAETGAAATACERCALPALARPFGRGRGPGFGCFARAFLRAI
jgi:hypothetical protein